MRLSFAILALFGPALFAQGSTNNTFTTSTSRTQTFHTTNNAVEVNNYLTRLTARIGAGPLLYDQTFNVQLSDSAVQVAIQQARTQLTNAGAVSITGPNQQSNTRTLTGTSQSTVVNSTQVTQDVGIDDAIGGIDPITGVQATALTGDRGLCTGLTGTAPARLPTGCPGGIIFIVKAGTSNTNVNTNNQSDIFQTTTTTSTYLTSQTYELNGTAAITPPATPAPPSLWLALTGIAAAGFFALSKRRHEGKES